MFEDTTTSSPFEELNCFTSKSNEDGVSVIDVSEEIEKKYTKEKKPYFSFSLGFQWKYYTYAPIRWADHAGGIVWYYILRILQWIALHLVPKGFQTDRKYAHLFNYPSAEEGRKASNGFRIRSSWFFPQRKPFIVIIDRLRRKCMFSEGRRFRVWKWVYFTIFILISLFFVYRYTSEQIEIHTYVTPDKMHEHTGLRVTNVVSMKRFSLSRTYGAEQQWLLHSCKETIELTPKILKWGYVDTESPLASMERVNISVEDLVLKMKRDSKTFGLGLPQPCLCGAHYGLPINVILLRPKPGEKKDHVLYEPSIQKGTATNTKGTISIDALVVPSANRGMNVSGRSLPISPIDGLGMYLRKHGEEGKTKMKEIFESYALPDNVFHNSVDLTSIGSDGVTPWVLKRSSIPLRDVKEDSNREVTVGYESFVVRGMRSDGSPDTATTIYSPHSICVQRCLETLNYIKLKEK